MFVCLHICLSLDYLLSLFNLYVRIACQDVIVGSELRSSHFCRCTTVSRNWQRSVLCEGSPCVLLFEWETSLYLMGGNARYPNKEYLKIITLTNIDGQRSYKTMFLKTRFLKLTVAFLKFDFVIALSPEFRPMQTDGFLYLCHANFGCQKVWIVLNITCKF